jgi:hypothetical protein
VLYCNQERTEAFCNGLLGLPIAARFAPLSMTFFTLGNHHDFTVDSISLADQLWNLAGSQS